LHADEFRAFGFARVVEEVGIDQPGAVVGVPLEDRVEKWLLVREVHDRILPQLIAFRQHPPEFF
jgi:hypothetical protein